MSQNIMDKLQECSTGQILTQLLKNSMSRSLLVERVLNLNVSDATKISLIKSASSANNTENASNLVLDMEGSDEAYRRHQQRFGLINWMAVESALNKANQEPQDKPHAQDEESHVYFIESKTSGLIKIGRSINPVSRFNAIRTMSPEELSLLGSVPESVYSEGELHKRFSKHRKHGEWFQDDPEIRALIAEIISA